MGCLETRDSVHRVSLGLRLFSAIRHQSCGRLTVVQREPSSPPLRDISPHAPPPTPPGHCKTVEFTFDMGEDTADCIAHEMMEDLSLSAEEAELIAEKIKDEISRIAGEYVDSLSLAAAQAAHERGEDVDGCGGAGGDETLGSDSLTRLDVASREAVMANAAAAAVVAVANAAAAVNSGSGGGGARALPSLARSGSAAQQQQAPAGGGVGGLGVEESGKSVSLTPTLSSGTGRPPSYYDIVRAMREFNAQQLEEGSQQSGDGSAGAPLEVMLPAGHALDTAVLARVASAAASAAAQQLAEVSPPPRNGQYPLPPAQQQQQAEQQP